MSSPLAGRGVSTLPGVWLTGSHGLHGHQARILQREIIEINEKLKCESVHCVDWYYWPGCRGDSRTPCWWRLRGRRRPRLLWTLYILSCPENCQWSRSVWTRGQYLGLEHLQTPSRPWRRSRTRPERLHVRTEWHWLATLFLEERRRTWVNRIEIWFLFKEILYLLYIYYIYDIQHPDL